MAHKHTVKDLSCYREHDTKHLDKALGPSFTFPTDLISAAAPQTFKAGDLIELHNQNSPNTGHINLKQGAYPFHVDAAVKGRSVDEFCKQSRRM